MIKKVIQVPMDRELLACLDKVSVKQKRARAELIREACLSYLRRVEADEMDIVYRRGYEKFPEKEDTGRAQATLIASVLPSECW
jgi:metal-responsive CopG/Arc/MetJ family transcriptional regulator